MGNLIHAKKEMLQGRIKIVLAELSPMDLVDAIESLRRQDAWMAFCPLCWELVPYIDGTIPMRSKKSGAKKRIRVHICGSQVIRTDYQAIYEWLRMREH